MRGAQWFYSLPENDNFACTAEKLYADYLGAEKFGNIFALDVGPDRAGRIRDIDVRTLKKVGQYIRGEAKLPAEPYPIKSVKASSEWSEGGYQAEFAVDNDTNTRWGASENSRSGWLQLELEKESTVNKAVIDEGDWGRVQEFEIQVMRNNQWATIYKGSAIGADKEITLGKIKAKLFRLNIIEANEVPTILEFKLIGHTD